MLMYVPSDLISHHRHSLDSRMKASRFMLSWLLSLDSNQLRSTGESEKIKLKMQLVFTLKINFQKVK